jgi:hypothetical protein
LFGIDAVIFRALETLRNAESPGEAEMHILLRILTFAVFIWLICHFFYSLGRKSALGEKKRKGESPPAKRKRVESSVVENDNHSS